MRDGLDDNEIVQGLRAGDREAWDALCHQYGEPLWRYVARLIGRDQEAVADVFQETLLAVARSGGMIRTETTIWPWLSRIGHNQAALYWRKRYRDGAIDQHAADGLIAVDGDPVATLNQRETVDLVRALLAEMHADQATLLAAKYLDGLSVAEIVAMFGGTTEGVRSSLARARRSFRTRYQQRIGVEQQAE